MKNLDDLESRKFYGGDNEYAIFMINEPSDKPFTMDDKSAETPSLKQVYQESMVTDADVS